MLTKVYTAARDTFWLLFSRNCNGEIESFDLSISEWDQIYRIEPSTLQIFRSSDSLYIEIHLGNADNMQDPCRHMQHPE